MFPYPTLLKTFTSRLPTQLYVCPPPQTKFQKQNNKMKIKTKN